MSGFAVPSHLSMPFSRREVSWASVWLGRITPRFASTVKPNCSATCRNISLCCPVATTVHLNSPAPRRAATTGASLIASGRVPMKIRMLFLFTEADPPASRRAPARFHPPPSPRDDLSTRQPHERGIGGQVPSPHLPGLHEQQPGPLHPRRLHPPWRAPDGTGEDVGAAADSHDHWNVQPLAISLAPRLLERTRHPDEQQVRRAAADVLHDRRVLVAGEVAVPIPHHLQPGVVARAELREPGDDRALGAEEIGAQPWPCAGI